MVDKPAEREGHQDHADEQDDRRAELQANGREPGTVVLRLADRGPYAAGAAAMTCQLGNDEAVAMGCSHSLINPEADEDAEGDGQVLESNQGSTHLRRRT